MGTPLNGRTFNKRKVSSVSDRQKDASLFLTDCIIRGCTVSASGRNITVQPGQFIAHGAKVDVDSAVTIQASAVSSGTVRGYLVCTIDLSKTNTATDCQQAQFEIITSSSSSYPTLTQQDIDNGSSYTKYQMPFVKFTQTSSGITIQEDVRPGERFVKKATLNAGSTSLTISDSRIRSTAHVEVWTSIWGVSPRTVTVNNGSIQLTFVSQGAAMDVEVRCS